MVDFSIAGHILPWLFVIMECSHIRVACFIQKCYPRWPLPLENVLRLKYILLENTSRYMYIIIIIMHACMWLGQSYWIVNQEAPVLCSLLSCSSILLHFGSQRKGKKEEREKEVVGERVTCTLTVTGLLKCKYRKNALLPLLVPQTQLDPLFCLYDQCIINLAYNNNIECALIVRAHTWVREHSQLSHLTSNWRVPHTCTTALMRNFVGDY